MACSTMNTSNWKFFPLGESSFQQSPTMNCQPTENHGPAQNYFRNGDSSCFQQSQSIHYICVPTSEELKQKIYSTVRNLQLDSENAVFQFWAPHKAGEAFVLTITNQPSGYSGNNEELLSYHNACLKHKLYVHPEEKVAFGLSGRAFLTCTPEQTKNVHDYPEDERPPSDDDAIFSRIWGSFAVPVIVDDQCVGVLEFVMDTPKDSYDSDIDKVYRALKIERPFQNASLQTPIQNEEPKTSFRRSKTSYKMIRRSKSFDHTKYSRLVPHFGLTSGNAAAKLGLKRSTFRNVCRRVRIYEWPQIPSRNRETRINLAAASKTSSSQILVALEDKLGYSDDSSLYMDTDTRELPREQTTNARAFVPETQIDQRAASETMPFQIPVDIGFFDNWSSYMDRDTFELPGDQTTNARASVLENQIDQIAARETRPFELPVDTGFSDNWSFNMDDMDTFESPCEQTINARLSVPETQINQTAASETRSFEDLQNTTNLSDDWSFNMDMSILEGLCDISEAQINQSAPDDVTWNIELEHPGAGLIMPEYDEMNYQHSFIYGTS